MKTANRRTSADPKASTDRRILPDRKALANGQTSAARKSADTRAKPRRSEAPARSAMPKNAMLDNTVAGKRARTAAGLRAPDLERKRARILQAAVREFSERGLAGARTDAISRAAEVNKALLYYYFESKERLYAAALKEAAGAAMKSALAAFDSASSPGESLLRSALNHFDRILTQQEFQTLMQQEMVRMARGESETLGLMVESLFKPLMARMEEAVRAGIRTGELCDVDWLQVIYATLGTNVFYFLSAPMMRLILPFDPVSPGALSARRSSAIEFLGETLFVDRRRGARIAKKVLAETPMPKIKGFTGGRRLG